FRLSRCWLRSATQVTYYCMLLGMTSLAAKLLFKLFRELFSSVCFYQYWWQPDIRRMLIIRLGQTTARNIVYNL
ncbi:hypothetical protein, partial [Providencia sp.]|uniref:hypothetical protein n=1 Tax=Providencia sp. TaxID=589 RepID=UPI0033417E3D